MAAQPSISSTVIDKKSFHYKHFWYLLVANLEALSIKSEKFVPMKDKVLKWQKVIFHKAVGKFECNFSYTIQTVYSKV